jgi:UDP-N-acetyl-D-glucosamine dehydrogenase
MPWYVVSKVVDALNERRKSVNGSNILVLGVTYKRNTNDLRESPALDIMKILQDKGAHVSFYDTFATELRHLDGAIHVSLDEAIVGAADCVIIATDHSNVSYEWVVAHAQLVMDTRNVTRDLHPDSKNIIKL